MSNSQDSLGDRMKSYEDSYRISLPIRMPVILRIDGKAFHSYTKGCAKPIDNNLINCMNETATYLCQNIQGCQLAYVQSDEISLLLVNYKELDSQSWFDNNLQKMVSVSSALASSYFTSISNKIFEQIKIAQFDSRAFVIPKEDVCNYFLWRQQDATRNSIQMLARSLYSHKELHGKNSGQLHHMCWEKGSNWNDLPTFQKRGRCIVKTSKFIVNINMNEKVEIPTLLPSALGSVELPACSLTERSKWEVDNEIPIFSQDRKYIEQYVYPLMKVEVPNEQHSAQHNQ